LLSQSTGFTTPSADSTAPAEVTAELEDGGR
jgi:hypothetical protein